MGKKALLFYITLFLLILAFSTTATHFDYDLWARLIAGMGVIDGGNVLTSDFYLTHRFIPGLTMNGKWGYILRSIKTIWSI